MAKKYISIIDLTEQLSRFVDEPIRGRASYYQWNSGEHFSRSYAFADIIKMTLSELAGRLHLAMPRWRTYVCNGQDLAYPLPPDCLEVTLVRQLPPIPGRRYTYQMLYSPPNFLVTGWGWLVEGSKIIFMPTRGNGEKLDVFYQGKLPYHGGIITVLNEAIFYDNLFFGYSSVTYSKGGRTVTINTPSNNLTIPSDIDLRGMALHIDDDIYWIEDYTTSGAPNYQLLTITTASIIGTLGDAERNIVTNDWGFGVYLPLEQDMLPLFIRGFMKNLFLSTREFEDAEYWRKLFEQELERKRVDVATRQVWNIHHIQDVI